MTGTSRAISALAFIFSLLVFGYRGWDGHRAIMPLDVVFVQQSLDPSNPFSGVNTPFGQFDLLRQFSGYLHTVVRVFVELFELAPFSIYPVLTFTTSTVIWAGCAWAVFLAVRSVAGPVAGLVGSAAFALLPASNIILLAQLNALQWPMLVASVILIATNFEPRSTLGKLLYLGFLFLLAANAALAFIPMAMLGWRLVLRWNLRDTTKRLTAMCIPYAVQVFAYIRQPGRRAEELNPLAQLFQEMYYIPKTLLPGFLRGAVDGRLSVVASALLLLIAVGFTATVIGAIRTSQPKDQRFDRVVVELIVIAVLSGVFSVVMNGNLNHQYLMIPMTCLWVAVIMSVERLHHVPEYRHFGQITALFALGVFVFSSVATWDKDLRDPFFSPPGLADLSSSLQRAQELCVVSPDDRVDTSGTGLVLPCEIVMTLR